MNADTHDSDATSTCSPVEQARQALSAQYAGAPVQIDGPISVRGNSRIFHALIEADEPFEAAIKFCLDPQTNTPGEMAAQEQFFALERINGALQKTPSRNRVPTPLCLMPGLAAYAMSWIDGQPLTRRMRHPAVFFRGQDWLEKTGAWLGSFHKAGPLRRVPVDPDDRFKVIEYLRAKPLLDRSFAEAIRILRQAAPTRGSFDVETSWLHGDCKTDNFFLIDQDVYGIDISLIHVNPVEYDLAQFLNNLDLTLGNPQNLYLAGMRSRLEVAFWRGYQEAGPSVSTSYLNWLRLSFAASFWHAMMNKHRPGIRKLVLNRMFAGLTGRLCRSIQEDEHGAHNP